MPATILHDEHHGDEEVARDLLGPAGRILQHVAVHVLLEVERTRGGAVLPDEAKAGFQDHTVGRRVIRAGFAVEPLEPELAHELGGRGGDEPRAQARFPAASHPETSRRHPPAATTRSSRSTWPRATRHRIARRTTSGFPWIARSTSACQRSMDDAASRLVMSCSFDCMTGRDPLCAHRAGVRAPAIRRRGGLP